MGRINNFASLDEMNRLATNILNLKRWEFQEKERLQTRFPVIVYQSPLCLIKLTWEESEIQGGYTLRFDYGRLHAPTDNTYILWNGEQCHCWHNISYALHFLDGHLPATVAGKKYRHPTIIEKFKKSDIGQSLRDREHQPEWLLWMHATVWEHYGTRLFDLFDLHQAHIWKKYREFIKGIYDIEGRSPNIKPPLDSIC